MANNLRVGYVPYSPNFTKPGDRRRFVYYATMRGIDFENADPSKEYDLVVLSARADISVWSKYPKGKLVYDLIDSYLAIPRTDLKGQLRGLFKFLSRQNRYLQLDHWKAIGAMCIRADAVVCSTEEQKLDILKFSSNVHRVLDAHMTVTHKVKTQYSAGSTQNGNWRQEFGRLITADRQFARATVNHIWANLFSHGIVDPPEAWDFERTNPNSPPPGDWPLQNSHPELLEELADYFIANNFQFRPLLRQILNSDAYQLSSTYQGAWQPAYVKYFARHEARRLSAEELYDSLTTATRTEQPMQVAGIDRVLWYANQLPDPNEPATDFRIVDFMNNLGRGNWITIDRSSEPTILGLLYSMNDSQNVNRTLGNSSAAVSSRSRIFEVDSSSPTDEEAIRRLFLSTLSRYPTDPELTTALKFRNGPRAQWLSDLQWAMVNKLDFIFNR